MRFAFMFLAAGMLILASASCSRNTSESELEKLRSENRSLKQKQDELEKSLAALKERATSTEPASKASEPTSKLKTVSIVGVWKVTGPGPVYRPDRTALMVIGLDKKKLLATINTGSTDGLPVWGEVSWNESTGEFAVDTRSTFESMDKGKYHDYWVLKGQYTNDTLAGAYEVYSQPAGKPIQASPESKGAWGAFRATKE